MKFALQLSVVILLLCGCSKDVDDSPKVSPEEIEEALNQLQGKYWDVEKGVRVLEETGDPTHIPSLMAAYHRLGGEIETGAQDVAYLIAEVISKLDPENAEIRDEFYAKLRSDAHSSLDIERVTRFLAKTKDKRHLPVLVEVFEKHVDARGSSPAEDVAEAILELDRRNVAAATYLVERKNPSFAMEIINSLTPATRVALEPALEAALQKSSTPDPHEVWMKETAAKYFFQNGDDRSIVLLTILDGNYFNKDSHTQLVSALKESRSLSNDQLLPYLVHFDLGPVIDEALVGRGWKPTSDRERFFSKLARRDTQEILEDWATSRRELFAALRGDDYDAFFSASKCLVYLGREDTADEIEEILKESQSRTLAKELFNCGHEALSAAAEKVLNDKGALIIRIGPRPKGGDGDWGRWAKKQ